MFRIIQSLNNNAALVKNEKGEQAVVIGLGITFQKKKGDLVVKEKIENIFALKTLKLRKIFDFVERYPFRFYLCDLYRHRSSSCDLSLSCPRIFIRNVNRSYLLCLPSSIKKTPIKRVAYQIYQLNINSNIRWQKRLYNCFG